MQKNKDNNKSSSVIKVFCVICRKYAKITDKIYSSSKCGHVFHRECIFKSLEHKFFCPECHTRLNKYVINRLFLSNYVKEDEKDEVETEFKSFYWMKLTENVTSNELERIGLKMGLDEEGDPVYAARVFYWEEEVPAYYIPKLKGVRFCWNKYIFFYTENFEILRVDDDDGVYNWVESCNDVTPQNALTGGYSDFGDPLYFARQYYENKLRFGKFHPPNGAYLVVNETEVFVEKCEVLTRKTKTKKEEDIKLNEGKLDES